MAFCAYIWIFFLVLVVVGCKSFSSKKTLIWYPKKEGIFSQFLQVKIMCRMAQLSDRQLVVTPFQTIHYSEMQNICSLFSLPNIICIPQIPFESCKVFGIMKQVSRTLLLSNQSEVCIKHEVVSLGGVARRDTFIHAVKLNEPKFMIHDNFTNIISDFKRKLGVIGINNESTPFTVVHWRRGDQLKARCAQRFRIDNSINCHSAKDLALLIRQFTNHSIVYIATNEMNKKELRLFDKFGYHTFNSVSKNGFAFDSTSIVNDKPYSRYRSKSPRIQQNSTTALMIDATLMLQSTTFLSWGVSMVNDVIEHERMVQKKSYCTAHNDEETIFPTWCWLQSQEKKMKNKERRGIDDEFIPLSFYNVSNMPYYQTELTQKWGVLHALAED